MANLNNPLICAIDTPSVEQARALCRDLDGSVGAIKLGLEFFSANGQQGVRQVADACGVPVFLDLKFHDIPNTVAGAVRSAMELDVFMLTVHAAGGKAMMRAAMDAARDAADRLGKAPPLVVAVTVLTSMDEGDLHSIGVECAVDAQVRRLADLAREAGLSGVVCSPHEIRGLRAQCGGDFALVVPGIRPAGSEKGDQKRVLTPREARALGATYLVVGRPITGAKAPRAAARELLESL